MKPFLALLKKDFLLSKWYTLFVALANLIGVPLFFLYLEPELGGTSILFAFCSFVSSYMMLAALSAPDTKCPRAEPALCCAPYPRKEVILARYVYLLCVYFLCLVIHVLWRLILPQNSLSLLEILLALLLNAVIISIYLPLKCRLGPQTASFILLALYIAGLFLLFDNVSDALTLGTDSLLSRFASLPAPVPSLLLLAVSFLFLAVSYCLSLWLYQKKDL